MAKQSRSPVPQSRSRVRRRVPDAAVAGPVSDPAPRAERPAGPKAVDALRSKGTLTQLADEWLSKQGAPKLS